MKSLPFFIAVITLCCINPLSYAETHRQTEKLQNLGTLAKSDNPVQYQTLTNVPEQSFGSDAILHQCWNATTLQGSPSDKKVIRPSHVEEHPPELEADMNPPVAPQLQNCIRRVRLDGDRKLIALTFDLCERNLETAGYDADIINYLRENHIKATFFAGGKWMRSHPEKTKQLMADPLFELGNHTWTHGNMRLLTEDEMRQQIRWTQAEYQQLRQELVKQQCVTQYQQEISKIPTTLRAFRFPYGTCKPEALHMLARYGLPAIQWDVVTGDPSPKQTAKAIKDKVLHDTRPGSIIVAHANGRGRATAQALSEFVPKLIDKGFEFVTISELLASGSVEATTDCYEETPGDNLKYDKLFGKGTD